jgi:hypothetical protein
MTYFQLKLFIVLSLIIFLLSGCSSESSNESKIQTGLSPLLGTWQQVATGDKEVTDFVVKIIFTPKILTMDAPGCMIIGNYTTSVDILTYTVTSMQGERCSKAQTVGETDKVRYVVTDSKLIMTPISAGKESQVVYKRISK